MAINPQLSRFTNPRMSRGAAMCVRAAAVKAIADVMPQPLKGQLEKHADQTIDMVADDFCGTRAPNPHGPWPGPTVQALDLASLITVYANTKVQPGQDSFRQRKYSHRGNRALKGKP